MNKIIDIPACRPTTLANNVDRNPLPENSFPNVILKKARKQLCGRLVTCFCFILVIIMAVPFILMMMRINNEKTHFASNIEIKNPRDFYGGNGTNCSRNKEAGNTLCLWKSQLYLSMSCSHLNQSLKPVREVVLTKQSM